MNIKIRELASTLETVKTIEEIYSLNYWGASRENRSDADLLDLTADYTGRIIQLIRVPLLSTALKSKCVMKTDGSCDIVLLNGLNDCNKKFAICKELFHILLDKEQYRCIDFEQTIDDYMYDGIDDTPSLSSQTEILAEIAAMEFLFKYSYRKLYVAQNNPDYYSIAKTHMIPQVMVERYLYSHYMKNLDPDSLQIV